MCALPVDLGFPATLRSDKPNRVFRADGLSDLSDSPYHPRHARGLVRIAAMSLLMSTLPSYVAAQSTQFRRRPRLRSRIASSRPWYGPHSREAPN
jgi:hypothetical protein